MMNENELSKLIERYMDGETSLDEEKRLEDYFLAHDKVAKELLPIRQMVLGLGALRLPTTTEEEPTAPEPHATEASKPHKTRLRIHQFIGIAASLLLIVGIALTLYRSQNYSEAIVYGQPTTDQKVIMRELSGTMRQIDEQNAVDNELRNVLMCAE